MPDLQRQRETGMTLRLMERNNDSDSLKKPLRATL